MLVIVTSKHCKMARINLGVTGSLVINTSTDVDFAYQSNGPEIKSAHAVRNLQLRLVLRTGIWYTHTNHHAGGISRGVECPLELGYQHMYCTFCAPTFAISDATDLIRQCFLSISLCPRRNPSNLP